MINKNSNPFQKKKKSIEVKWVYKTKKNAKREVEIKIQSKISGQGSQATIKHTLCEQEINDCIIKNPTFQDRSKHIDTRYHFIREYIMKKEV